jgi:hypothetical protein
MTEDANAPIEGEAYGIAYDVVHISKEEAEAAALNAPQPALNFVTSNHLQEDTMALDQEVTTVQDPEKIDPATLEPAVNTIITETKTGYKTTEFWVTVIVSLFAVVDPASLPDWAQGGLLAIATGAYAISRGLAKQGIPNVEETVVPPAA